LPLANFYLRITGRGEDYSDACYLPTYWGRETNPQVSLPVGNFQVVSRSWRQGKVSCC